jgi:hypothetical protein
MYHLFPLKRDSALLRIYHLNLITMFTSKNLIQSSKSGLSFLKGATFFFLGMSLVLFAAKAFEVVPSTTNVSMVLKSIRLTADGTQSAATGVYLDGSGGKIVAQEICFDTDCETSRPSSGGTPGGNTNAIQFNDGSGFSGTTRLTWDNSANTFGLM